MAQVVARTRNPVNDVVVANLKKFRDAVGMTTEQAAQHAKLSLDSLRRWEAGGTMPHAEALRALGKIYGHTMDDFYLESPPPANLVDRVEIQLMTLPGVDVPKELLDGIQKKLDEANEKLREIKLAAQAAQAKAPKKAKGK